MKCVNIFTLHYKEALMGIQCIQKQFTVIKFLLQAYSKIDSMYYTNKYPMMTT